MRAELGWLEPRSRAQVKMIRLFHRLICMSETRITKKIFLWDRELWHSGRAHTWTEEVESILDRNNMKETFNLNIFSLKDAIDRLKVSLISKDMAKLKNLCHNLPKLRSYVSLADFSAPKMYLTKPMSYAQRRMIAKIRLGCLPIRIETGRFERPKKNAEQRICLQCHMDEIESEEHFLLVCPRHSRLRSSLLGKFLNESCQTLDQTGKLAFLLNDSSAVKATAQFILKALENRLT